MAYLAEYRAKRNFARTREPAGKARNTAARQIPHLRFVIQKHQARRLHYDFRLESGGVLKSWAVPKGPPLRRGERRLALQVEDHPLEYAGFEGTIPEGNYGAGAVMVWDQGTYEPAGAVEQGLQAGKLRFTLQGKKLKGEWTLVCLGSRKDEETRQWLLLKSGEDAVLRKGAEDHSALTGRTLAQISVANDKQWTSAGQVQEHSADPPQGAAARPTRKPKASSTTSRRVAAPINLRRLPRAEPGFMEPMKAQLVDELPRGPESVYEIKFDGVRALGIKRKNKVELLSRTRKDLGAKYPAVAQALRQWRISKATVDGEIVAVDNQGRSDFQLLQSYHMAGEKKPPLLYYVFDLINLDGRDLTRLPLEQRKAAAQAVLKGAPPIIRFSASITADSEQLMREMRACGLEGLVAKRRDSPYEPGRRSGAWVKFKWTHQQEFVIGGYTRPKGARPHFGAILVGYYEGKRLRFAAKVGTGFSDRILDELYEKFQELVQPDCPFANLREEWPGSRGQGVSRAEMKSCTWLKPKLVCEVRFAGWTRDLHLRQPSFLGLRDDKNPEEVVRENPQTKL
ncbi:DNA polymerase LigD, ligase domain protein [Verrucomicrobia bacterium]|nr:DNA polymerase LigD, ligase domain protein [Verrucomicrobiota bacterium]